MKYIICHIKYDLFLVIIYSCIQNMDIILSVSVCIHHKRL